MASLSRVVKYGKRVVQETDKKSINPKNWDWQKIIWPFRVLFHPIQAFSEIKYENKGSIPLSIFILLLWFFSNVFDFLEKGFQFNTNRAQDLSINVQFMSSAMVIILLAIANWAICTLLDGEGWFKDIFITFSYSVMPMVITMIPVTVISKVLTTDESAFVSLITTVAFAWSVLLIFLANTTVHQYTVAKSVGALILTIVGVLILLVIIVLVISLFMQVYGFIRDIVSEISLRVS